MKITLIGQDIPRLLPALLADLFFACKADAEAAIEERNESMRELLQRYGDAVAAKAGRGKVRLYARRRDALDGADAVIYAGEPMAASRFRMDQEALSGIGDADEGLRDQARTLGGIGGLMRTLRQGEAVYTLCDEMRDCCPDAVVISLGQPVARTVEMFRRGGFPAWGLTAGWRKGPGGLEWLCRKLRVPPEKLDAEAAGLPDFCFLTRMADRRDGRDWLASAMALAAEGELGRLSRRWLASLEALPVGSIPDHAAWMAAQEDYAPDPNPALAEPVEQRKERIRRMNLAAEKGLSDREGQAAQLLLLAAAPAQRPCQLALALLRQEDLALDAAVRPNSQRAVQNLPLAAVVEAPLTLSGGVEQPAHILLPGPLAELCLDIDETSRLAAQAAAGDWSALRECVELDPALASLDRLYVQEVVARMIDLHRDILSRWEDAEEDEY